MVCVCILLDGFAEAVSSKVPPMATIPVAAPSRHLISVDAFHRMGEAGILGPADRVELIDGEIILYARHGIPEVWVIDAATRRTQVFHQPAGGREPGRSAGSDYATEVSVEPHEPLSCAGVVDDAGGRVVIELARLLPTLG
jgi:hypothetical protein